MSRKKLIPLTIDRERWARGGVGGEASLLNGEGNMCCLGFACRAVGVSAAKIRDNGMPDSVVDATMKFDNKSATTTILRKLAPLVECENKVTNNTPPALNAQMENDSMHLDEPTREALVKQHLRQAGFSVKFVGSRDHVRLQGKRVRVDRKPLDD